MDDNGLKKIVISISAYPNMYGQHVTGNCWRLLQINTGKVRNNLNSNNKNVLAVYYNTIVTLHELYIGHCCVLFLCDTNKT